MRHFERLLLRVERMNGESAERVDGSVTMDELRGAFLAVEPHIRHDKSSAARLRARVEALLEAPPRRTAVVVAASRPPAQAAPSSASCSSGVGDEWKRVSTAERPTRWHLRHTVRNAPAAAATADDAAPAPASLPFAAPAAGLARSAARSAARMGNATKRHVRPPRKTNQKEQQERLKEALSSMAGELKLGALALNSNLRDSNLTLGTIQDDAETNLESVTKTAAQIKERAKAGRCGCLVDCGLILLVVVGFWVTYAVIKMFPKRLRRA